MANEKWPSWDDLRDAGAGKTPDTPQQPSGSTGNWPSWEDLNKPPAPTPDPVSFAEQERNASTFGGALERGGQIINQSLAAAGMPVPKPLPQAYEELRARKLQREAGEEQDTFSKRRKRRYAGSRPDWERSLPTPPLGEQFRQPMLRIPLLGRCRLLYESCMRVQIL